jgi:hypothetical protein
MNSSRPLDPLPDLAPGLYQHYKGPQYQVLGVVRHSETLELLVLYHPVAGDQALWVRPWAMFTGQVEIQGRAVPRFARVPSQPA